MELLGERISQDHTSTTADTKSAAATLIEAAGLLSDVEREFSEMRGKLRTGPQLAARLQIVMVELIDHFVDLFIR